MSTRIGLILLGAFFVFESILGCFSGKMYFKYGGWSAVEPVYIIKIFIIGVLFASAGIFINKKIGRVIKTFNNIYRNFYNARSRRNTKQNRISFSYLGIFGFTY